MSRKKKNPAGVKLPGGRNPNGQSKDNTPKEAPGKALPALNGNSQEAIEFLDWYRPEGLMNLVAIPQEGGTPVGITRVTGSPELKTFIEQHNGRNNLYFMVNEPKSGSPDKKLGENDVAFVHAVYSDVDPEAGAGFESERQRIKAQSDSLLADPDCPASFVINSGGGDQHFWKLETPLDGQRHKQDCKDIGAALKTMTGGDAVQNTDRIMRLPGTVNLPKKAKRDKGQPVAVAAIYAKSDRSYNLSELEGFTETFKAPQPEQPQEEPPEPTQTATAIDLQSLHPELAGLVRDGVLRGERSEKFHHVVGWLKDEGHSTGAITNLLEAHPGGIAEKYKGRLGKEVMRCFAKAEDKTASEYPSLELEGGIQVYTIDDLMNQPPPEYLVDDVLPEKGVAILAGVSGDMKSFLAINYGLSVATGQRVGQCNVKRGGVFYFLNEGQAGIAYRSRAWRDHYNQQKTDLFRIVKTAPNLMKTENIKPFIKAIEGTDLSPRLIIIDTFSKATIGGDDNSVKDMAAALHSAYVMASHFDCLVLLIDHKGKDAKKGLRGSSAKFANADAVILIKKTKGADGKTVVTLTVDKMKDGEDGKAFTFGVELQSVNGKTIPVLVPTGGTSAKLKQRDWIQSRISFAGFILREQLEEQFLEEYPDSQKGSFRTVLNRLTKAEILQEVDGFIRETGE